MPNLFGYFKGFDVRSALVTLVVAPILLYMLKTLVAYCKKWAGFVADGLLTLCSRYIMHSLTARLTLKRYCHLQMAGQSKFLHVPSASDVKVDIDKAFVPLALEKSAGEPIYTQRSMLTVDSRIRIVGDPGSGKSSLVKRVLRDSCMRGMSAPSQSRLPILLELKNVKPPSAEMSRPAPGDYRSDSAIDRAGWLYGVVRKEACGFNAYRMDECFDNYAQTQGLLILLYTASHVSAHSLRRVALGDVHC